MAIRLFTETAAAWVAVCLTAGGGLVTTAIHYGSTNQQIAQIAQAQKKTDDHVAKHDDQISEIKQLQAAQSQQLSDIAATVHDIHDNGVKRK